MAGVADQFQKIFGRVLAACNHCLKILELSHPLVQLGNGIAWFGKDIDVAVTDLSDPVSENGDKVLQQLVARVMATADQR